MTTDPYEIEPGHPGGAANPVRARSGEGSGVGVGAARPGRSLHLGWLAPFLTVALCVGHTVLIWYAVGGRAGLENPWPPLRFDHGIQFHHGLTTTALLRQTGTTAGYDPSFTSGMAMSILSGPSTTITDLAMAALPGNPALAYKLFVFACAAAAPWLVALAAIGMRARPGVVMVSTLFLILYFWTDAPASYGKMGMSPYLLSVPLGLVAAVGLAAYLDRGGFLRWLGAAAACSAVFLVHVTSPMIVAPAGLAAYAAAIARPGRMGWARHLGLWLMVPVILAANAFWWLPGFVLRSTQAPPGLMPFAHPEPLLQRLGEIAWTQAPIEPALLGLSVVGLLAMWRRTPILAASLGGFLAAGFAWGYLAGAFRSLDSLQPGRHTLACYSAACLIAAVGLVEILSTLRQASGPERARRLDVGLAATLILITVRMCGPTLQYSWPKNAFGPEAILRSDSTAAERHLIEVIRREVRPGERIFYEETGLGIGEPEPFGDRHLSALLPWLAGVEVIGGPYLHMAITTNFAQFGEGKLCGMERWDRAHFVRYARLYRPSAIACWSRAARQFCVSNPDLIRVVDDTGQMIVGRVVGFEGSTIEGTAKVEASAGRLVVRDAEPNPQGLVVLRYHAVPYLRATPPATIEPVTLEGDPVPFIGLRGAGAGPIEIEMVTPPATWFRQAGGSSTTAK